MNNLLQACLRPFLCLALLAAAAGTAHGLIDPKFTPVHLVKQSARIVALELEPARDGRITANVKQTIKGAATAGKIVLDLTKTAYKEHAAGLEKVVAARKSTPALLFVGRQFAGQLSAGTSAAPRNETAQRTGPGGWALLHVEGIWVELDPAGDHTWDMSQISTTRLGTWNGGTDMLAKAVDYILANPATAELPVSENVAWLGQKRFARFEGTVGMMTPVDLDGTGKLALYVACDSGDRLFAARGGEAWLADITASRRLVAKSRCAAWGALKAGGRMDLLSAGAEGLTAYVQQSDGTFRAGPKLPQSEIRGELLGLQVIDGPVAGRAVVLMNVSGTPYLWPAGDEQAVPSRLAAAAPAELGRPGPFVLADLDGDGLPDLLRVYEKGGLLHRGRGAGAFAEARPCAVAAGHGRTNALVGDFGAGGRLDVVTVASDDRTRLWVNRGEFEFVETFSQSGELSYKGDTGAIGGSTCDFNNDGRQDLMFYYLAAGSHMYFNRGFRTFGVANGLDLGAHGLLPQAEEGQQAGCVADLDGNGAQELILILKNGEGWVCRLDPGDTLGRCARGVLPPGGKTRGPVTVAAWRDGRCLGAWNAVAGTSEAYVAQTEACSVVLRWRLPDGAVREKTVRLGDRPGRVMLDEGR
jgi:hypothetical protein